MCKVHWNKSSAKVQLFFEICKKIGKKIAYIKKFFYLWKDFGESKWKTYYSKKARFR